MNTFLSFLGIVIILFLFVCWVSIIFNTKDDIKLYFYKEQEKRDKDAKYIENAEAEKDRQLLKEYEDELERLNNNG